VANYGGLEAMSWENLEIRISKCGIYSGVRNVSRKCKELDGEFSKLRKIEMVCTVFSKINFGTPNQA
jgi:hypothetical protein